MRKFVRIQCLFAGLFLFMTGTLRAQELDAAVTWSSNPRQGTFIVRYYPSLALAKPEAPKQNALVFFSLVDLDTDSVSVIGTRSKEIVCRFRKDKFEITLEPGVPNANLLGRCGAAITGLVSVKRNGKSLLDQEPFENLDCFERGRYIQSITLRDGFAAPKIRYGTQDE
jgi:hypothetical protein